MSLKQKFSTLALAATIVVGSVGAALAAPAWATSPVNVRSEPNTSSRVLDVLKRGERVEIDYCRGSWCYVEKSGPNGWVSANYLTRDSDDYYDDDYYDDRPIYIERPRRHYRRPYVGGEFCVGNPNASFCIGSRY